MKIKPEYTLRFEEEGVSVVRVSPAGEVTPVSPISDTAAMAWEGFERGFSRPELAEAIVTEFGGVTREQVEQELDELAAQLIALGYAEE